MVPRNRSRLGTVPAISPLNDSMRTAVACRVTASDPREAPMRKALTLICLTLLASFSALALPLALRPAVAQAATPTTAELRLVAAINRVRVGHDLPKLRCRSPLLVAARAHARDLSERELLSHTSENGWSVSRRARYFGYTTSGCTYWTVGENLARVVKGSPADSARVIVRLWMGSSAHRAVLLAARLRDIGVGIRVGADGMRYFTVDLGRRVL